MKRDTLFKHKEIAITCEESMGDANEYNNLLEPSTKQKKASEGRWIDVIYSQCNKSRHSKEHYHWNPNNSNNKLKDKKEVAMNGILTQTRGSIGNKFDKKRGCGKANKSSSIIYCCFICKSIEHVKLMTTFIRM